MPIRSLFYLAVGCIGGLAPLYAAAHAEGDALRLSRLRSAGWLVAAILALPVAALVWAGPTLLPFAGIDTALIERGAGYMRAMALTLPVMLAVAILRTRLTAIERPGVMLRVTLAAVPLNALFNHVFMHGAWGFDGLGVTGAGVSSLVVGALILSALVFESRRMNDNGLARPEAAQVAEILRVGLPIGIATLAEVGVYLGATLYCATLSVSDAAAHSITIRLAGVTYAVYFGLQQAATVRMARQSANDHQRQRLAATAITMSVAAGVLLLMLVVGMASPLSEFMLGDDDGNAALIAFTLLLLLAVSDLVGPAGAASAGLLRGLKVTRPVMTISPCGQLACCCSDRASAFRACRVGGRRCLDGADNRHRPDLGS